jgi:hypothetical protein
MPLIIPLIAPKMQWLLNAGGNRPLTPNSYNLLHCGAFYAYGKETVKTLPLPGVESNVISPFNSVIER